MSAYYLYTFESTHGAISSHQLLKTHMKAVIMPVLREINASCGMAVKVEESDFEQSLAIMKREGDTEFALYHIDGAAITKLDT